MKPVRLLRIFTILLWASSASGQHYPHTAVWLRFAPTLPLNDHWSLTADLWYRRQSDFHSTILNPIAAPLLQPSGRIGINYRTIHWVFTLFPVSMYRSFPALGKESDFRRPRTNEFRPSALVEWTSSLLRQYSVRLRAGYEYRRFVGVPATGRARFRILFRKELADKTYASLWNETLLPVSPNVAVHQLYEINRSNLALGRSLNKHLILEAGYQFSHRQRRSLTEFDEEHAITVTGFYRF